MTSRIVKWFFITLFVIAAGYSVFGIVHFKYMYAGINTAKAEFLKTGNPKANTTVALFTTYPCGHCKELYQTIKELKEVRKDIKFITHPISFKDGETDRLSRVAIAAGLQGRFWEMHAALMEHPNFVVTDVFIEETASIYGIDLNQFTKDRSSKETEKILNKANKALFNAGLKAVPSLIINNKIYIMNDKTLPTLKDILELIAQIEK